MIDKCTCPNIVVLSSLEYRGNLAWLPVSHLGKKPTKSALMSLVVSEEKLPKQHLMTLSKLWGGSGSKVQNISVKEMVKVMMAYLAIRLLESPCLLVPPSPENIASYIANAYTMRSSSQMYDAVKMMMIIIIYVRCDHHHDDYHHHLCTMRSSSR